MKHPIIFIVAVVQRMHVIYTKGIRPKTPKTKVSYLEFY